MSAPRDRKKETEFQRVFYSALGDPAGVVLLKELVAKNPDLASQFKPLFLDIANANLRHLKKNPNEKEESVIKELVVYLNTLPDPKGGRRKTRRRRQGTRKTKHRGKK